MFNKKLKQQIEKLKDKQQDMQFDIKWMKKEINQLRCEHHKTVWESGNQYGSTAYLQRCTICEKVLNWYKDKDEWKLAKAMALQAEVEELMK